MKSLLVALLAVSAVAQQRNPFEIVANKELVMRYISSHPQPIVRMFLGDAIKAGKVSVEAKTVGVLFASVEKQGVVLWYDSLMKFAAIEPEDKMALLLMDFVHEAKRIENHFAGKVFLESLDSKPSGTPKEQARRIWNSEWDAVQAEWEFAKANGWRRLMPLMKSATDAKETGHTQ